MTPDEAVSFVREAYASKSWTLAVGGVLMLSVRVLGAIKPVAARLPAGSQRWLALGLAAASSAGTALVAGASWALAAVNGVTAGLLAIGTWEALGKALPIIGASKPAELPAASLPPPGVPLPKPPKAKAPKAKP